MKLYRFSPIESEEKLFQAYEYIAQELEKLSQKLIGDKLQITTLKIFAHYPKEYEYLHNMIKHFGPEASSNSQTSFYTHVSKHINSSDINYLGVRVVDPYRLHVGCGDFETNNFEDFKEKYLGTSPFIREFNGVVPMLELWHPDFDVLGYIVPSET